MTEQALKASYIYNFAKFTDWPDGLVQASAPIVLCVLGDPAVGEALIGIVKGRVLSEHAIEVSIVGPAGPQGCHLLYVSGVTLERAAKIVAGVRDQPVLTISDVDGFGKAGGIAQFFFESGKLRFTIELPAIARAHLHLSSQLLGLAHRS